MRFAELSLERYGRFEDCRLRFRSGEPDLHVVFGQNEAGKSTTLSAVSDLLFGFPPRSPFNFRFDYGLLRIGAVLEEDGQRFACRRRKATGSSLVDADDRPLDDAPLAAMLRGQGREPFRLGFSLDQTRLREGGRAMVDARHDLGQALFAAGSGMTEVASVLGALKQEADEIWGPRASVKRAYTAAERQLAEAAHRLKELQLRPKAWTDAQTLLRQQAAVLEDLQRQRAELATERRRLERLRRIGPDARRRSDLLRQLEQRAEEPWISAEREASAVRALADLESAQRMCAAALGPLTEIETRLQGQAPDVAALAVADAVRALLERRGAELKAALDLDPLRSELSNKSARSRQLRAEVGGAATVPRLVVARLRDLSSRDGELRARLADLAGQIADAAKRAEPLREALAGPDEDTALPALAAAVDDARALGADIDARCSSGRRELERREAEVRAALDRLSPWTGDAEALRFAVVPSAEEIDAAQAAIARAREDQAAARENAARAAEDLAALALQRRTAAEGGIAVPPEAVSASRETRNERWTRLRAWLLGAPAPTHPQDEADAFQVAVAEADEIADRRFALAEASGRLAALDARLAAQELACTQAAQRLVRAAGEAEHALAAWSDRLAADGMPAFEPQRLRGWLQMRQDALNKMEAAARAAETLETDERRRAAARDRLLAFVQDAAEGETLAPLLEKAAALRATGETRRVRVADLKAQLRGLDDHLAELERSRHRAAADRAAILQAWEVEHRAAGLDLGIEGAEHRLTAFEELRALDEAIEGLERRIAGIERDARAFAADVHRLADDLEEPADADPVRRLDAVRSRVEAARAVDMARRDNQATASRLRDDLRAAQAARDAALASLQPRLDELGVSEIERLPERLEASRQIHQLRAEFADAERRIGEAGDGYSVADLIDALEGEDPDALAARLGDLDVRLGGLDAQITDAADAVGSARRAFETLESGPRAAEAAEDAALARAELDAQAELYVLKRAQATALRWALDRYRERRQNPLLTRASELFRTLTLGRYLELRIDLDAASPRLLGLCEDHATLVEVDSMSEGTADQLFLALRLAAVEQTIAGGIRLPFLADDLFVNFDDARARAGLDVLKELSTSTQVLVFTHHAHLVDIAREVVGAELLSECPLH